MAITVVLKGAPNDKIALQTAVLFAAREGQLVRVVLGPDCAQEALAKHLRYCLWEVSSRLSLSPPTCLVEWPEQTVESSGDSWTWERPSGPREPARKGGS